MLLPIMLNIRPTDVEETNPFPFNVSEIDVIKELTDHPDGELATTYVRILRRIKPAWAHESDTQLIARAIRVMNQRINAN